MIHNKILYFSEAGTKLAMKFPLRDTDTKIQAEALHQSTEKMLSSCSS
jgi:hypothetical protein